ncbi:hypothetical protein F511_12984 [Dorcoceras hygrometricum]|uniref:Uncharacterized protein n=1 Tax=Dorcoceras hygrometricum TaxID=472368 RepID=A0A2Z7BGR8_9LAMI|nr:hypothetical protein F511_12984 [Dorcoceras hygrometricum]
MSLFDLQDVRIAIGSIATLDLPMVVDLIGIYGLKGPYCTLTTTDWFFQELSVIPRGSWGDVARRFTMIRWAGVSFLVVDRIGDFYRNLPRRADVIVTTVGARHKCQQGIEAVGRRRRPPPPAAARPPRTIVRVRHHDDRDMDAHVARPGGDDGCKFAPCCDDGRPMHAAGLRARRCAWIAVVRRSKTHDGWRMNARWSRDHRTLSSDVAPLRRDVARGAARCRRDLRGGGAAGRPPLRRCSGDVVTVGLISSRVLVRACPGLPVKFLGQYTMSGPVLIDF